MSRKLFQITFSILLLVGMLLGLAAKDGVLANAPAAQENPTAKIEAQLLTQLTAGPADFIVMMREQADVSAAAGLQTKLEKGQYVFDTLTATATRTQADLRAYLDSQSADYRPFYIFNGFWVKQGSLELAQTIAARADVASLAVNQTFQLDPPIDPRESTAQPNYVEPNISFVKADQVWAMGFTGQGTVMAGNDTGLDVTHPTILPHYRGCLNPPTCDQLDHNYNWYDAFDPGGHPTPWDDYGHGTHTTGTMVGDDFVGNQIGVAPGATTIHCKNMQGGGGDVGHFNLCFEWDLAPWDLNGQNPRPDLAPHAINNSWGFGGGGNNGMRVAVDNLIAAGIVVEVSAGNEGSGCQTLRSPGDYAESITTGSVNHANAYPGTITGFSSRGPSSLDQGYFPDFMAPGENIRSALPGNSYGYWGGTSMAGPHITALIGLIWSANPALIGQVDTTYDIIRQTVVPLTGQNGSNCGGDYVTGPNNDWGYGTMDALAAAQLAISYGGAGVLQGTVTDAATGFPVEGATVRAVRQEGGTWTGTTNASGFYQITVASGTFDITASSPYYMAETAYSVVVAENETVTQDFSLTPRGYAFGWVYDFDNSFGIAGATVTAEDNSFATTDSSGYYMLWLDPGQHTLTASAPDYAPESAPVEIFSGESTWQDFYLQAAVVFIPSPIDVSVPLGSTHSEPATILNRQPWDYTFEFTERDGGYLPLGGETVSVELKASPASAPANTAVAVSGYTARPASTFTVERRGGVDQTNVLLLAADDDNNGYSPIMDELLAFGDLDGVSLYDPRNSTPSLAELQNYNVVVVWSNYMFADATGIGNVLADYVDGGGKVIDLNFALDPNWGYQGRFRTEGYTALTHSGTSYNTSCLGTFDPSHPIMEGITDVCDLYRGWGTALTAGSYEVARWQDNELFVAAKEDGSVVTINGYPGIYRQFTGQFPAVLHNAILWIAVPADVLWMTEDPALGVVPADGSLAVNINFDASPAAGVTQPGNYYAELTVKGTPKVKVPVHMFVEAPVDWGRLDGTVQSLGYCDGNPAALPGAFVEIVGIGTFETDANGYYATWLPAGTYTVNVTAGNHISASSTVTVGAGQYVTQNFSLRVDDPCLTADPLTMSATLEMGGTSIQQLTLTNNGAGLGTFEMSDLESGYTPMRQNFLPAAVRPSNPDTTPSSIGRAPNASSINPAELNKAISAMVGEPAFAVDVYPGYNLVSFTNDNPGAWTVVAGLPGSQYFGGDFINGDYSTLYVVDYGTNSLYTVDTTTGAVTLIGPSVPGGGESWTGLTGATDGTMYGVATTCGSSTLYTVDLTSGALTSVGNITNGSCVIDIAITPEGLMFGVEIVNDNLISIDPSTGAGTVIGSLGFNANYAQGMDYEETSGTLYLAAYSSQGELRIADPATGNTQLVGAFPGGAEVDSLAFATGGGGDALWLSEDPTSGTIPSYWPLKNGTAVQPSPMAQPVPGANVALSAKVSNPTAVVMPAVKPEDVLWDQFDPTGTDFAAQDFEAMYDVYDIYAGDDFQNIDSWNIESIRTAGGWGGYVDISNASAIHWYIFPDDGTGKPAGVPGDGTEYWSISLPTSDSQVALGVGIPEDVVLTLNTPVSLPAGHWWLVHFVSLEYGLYGQWGWRGTNTAVWGGTGSQNNPGGGFGLPAGWSPNQYGSDFSFTLNGIIDGGGDNTAVIDVTFDAGQVALPGTYTGQVKAKTNDPVAKTFTVEATMIVNAPQNWGQLAGTVTGLGYCDAESYPLQGAEVQIMGGLKVETDANGYYILWLEAGTYDVVVTADGHTVGYATVVINPDHQVTTQNFDLRWTQPCLSETPASLTVTLDLGQTQTEQLTLSNTGVAEGTFEVSDSDKGYTPKLARKPLVPDGNPVTVEGSSSKSPVQLFKSRITANDVLLISTTDVSQSVERALSELGYAYDYFSGSPWTGIDFTPYTTVLVAMDGGLAEAADIAKLRTDVIDEGKKLIFLGGTCYQPFAQAMNDYIVQNDTNNYCWQITNPPNWTLVDSTHPLADGLPDSYNYLDYAAGYYSIRVTDPDAEVVGINGEGWPAFFRKATDGDFIWYIDSVYSAYWTIQADFDFLKQIIQNSIEVTGGGDALWLTEAPLTGVVAPDTGEQVIDVTFDAGVVTQPGTYSAEIKIKTNDPVNSKFIIPVTMNVNGPPDWGRIEGVVSSLGYCDENPFPAEGATVLVDGILTLTTDANGHYSTWLEQGTHELVVSADGHVSDSITVVVVAQQTTVQDFGLRVVAPCVDVTPTALEVTLAPDTQTTETLSLVNTGAGSASFKITEMAGKVGLGNLAGGNFSLNLVPAGSNPNLTVASPVAAIVPVAAAARPEAVLWDQPLSVVNQGAFVDQEFSDYPDYTSWLADDFINEEPWEVTTIFVPGGGWNGFSTLMNAESLTWAIFPDAGGVPDGDPWTGGAIWTLTLSPSDGQVTITNGSMGLPSDTLVELTEPVTVPDGHWWLVFYPTMSFSGGGQFGRQPSDTVNGYTGQFKNPGGAFGFGTEWVDWTGLGGQPPDIAFRLEGDIASIDIPWVSEDPTQGTVAADSTADVAVTFDATGLAFGDYTGTLRVRTGDPNNATVVVPLTLHVAEATAPVASFTATTVVVGNPTVFTNTSDLGIPPATEFEWDFGDGITVTVSTADPVEHTYATFGTFTVSLTACNVAGCDTFTDDVVVKSLDILLPLVLKP